MKRLNNPNIPGTSRIPGSENLQFLLSAARCSVKRFVIFILLLVGRFQNDSAPVAGTPQQDISVPAAGSPQKAIPAQAAVLVKIWGQVNPGSRYRQIAGF